MSTARELRTISETVGLGDGHTLAPRTMSVYGIALGERHRRDLGDIDALARSIAEVGLLHPIVVTSEGKLIAGERRLMAVRSLGWDEIYNAGRGGKKLSPWCRRIRIADIRRNRKLEVAS